MAGTAQARSLPFLAPARARLPLRPAVGGDPARRARARPRLRHPSVGPPPRGPLGEQARPRTPPAAPRRRTRAGPGRPTGPRAIDSAGPLRPALPPLVGVGGGGRVGP